MSDDQNLDPNGEEAVEAGVPEWVPEKFRSNPEKFAEAYENLEREFHSSRQQIKGLEETVQHQASQWEEFQAQQNRPDPNTVYAQWQEAFDVDPVGTIAQIAQATANQVHQQYAQQTSQPAQDPNVVAWIADQSMTAKYADWDAYKSQVGDLIANDPLYARDDLYANHGLATQALESAYERVKARDVLSGNNVVQQQAADTRQMKLNAQTAVGASGRPPANSSDADEWARIRAAAPKNYWE